MWRAGILLVLASAAVAEAPLHSPRPTPRPQIATTAPATGPANVTATASAPETRPKPRPAVLQTPAPQTPTLQTASAPQPSTSRTGSVCDNPAIKGVALKPIKSRTRGCNVAAPVLISSINGVKLVPAATINCAEAAALAAWITNGLQPAYNNQVARLNIANSYACRPRNNQRGAKVSEHGSGNAIDIEGFVLTTGKTLTVLRNFNAQMRRAHKAACGTFHTTLGPGSDGHHENHLHLDVADYRGNPYCR